MSDKLRGWAEDLLIVAAILIVLNVLAFFILHATGHSIEYYNLTANFTATYNMTNFSRVR